MGFGSTSPLGIGFWLAVLYSGTCVLLPQASGQPAVLYYAPLLLKRVGLDGDVAANLATVGLGVAKVFVVCFFVFVLKWQLIFPLLIGELL